MRNAALNALSPLDGRYASQVSDLSLDFSEAAIIRRRLEIEVRYLIFLGQQKIIHEFSPKEIKQIQTLVTDFSTQDADAIKLIEQKINHDVKAVEYFLQTFLKTNQLKNAEFVHIGLTSEDINNCVYSLAIQNSLVKTLIPNLETLINAISDCAQENKTALLLAKTHGQPAVPTTFGKEMIVFAVRLAKELKQLKQIKLEAKLTGAVGNFNAHQAAFPKENWIKLSYEFISQLGLKPNLHTTQILPPDSYLKVFYSLQLINNILLDFNADIWRYISDGVLTQTANKSEVGSSTMPQKVNPIDFENSEGNLGLANSMLQHFCQKLPISRLQRDLSDSVVKRSIGVAFGHCLLAYQSTAKGLKKVKANRKLMDEQLNHHWEVVAEGIQTILRTTGDEKAYDKLKILTRGKELNHAIVEKFIDTLDLEKPIQQKLLNLTPKTYLGLAEELLELGVEEVTKNLSY